MISKSDMAKLSTIISSASEVSEIREIQDILASSFRRISRAKSNEFRVGQRVSFTSRTGSDITGKVLKINQKTVSIEASNGSRWKVSSTLLRVA